jgi:hypothetical protein
MGNTEIDGKEEKKQIECFQKIGLNFRKVCTSPNLRVLKSYFICELLIGLFLNGAENWKIKGCTLVP